MDGFCQQIDSILTCRSCLVAGIDQPSDNVVLGSVSSSKFPNTQGPAVNKRNITSKSLTLPTLTDSGFGVRVLY